MVKAFCAIAAAVVVTASSGGSDDSMILAEQFEASGAAELSESLPDETEKTLDELGIVLGAGETVSAELDGIAGYISDQAVSAAKNPLSICLCALGLIMLCSLVSGVFEKSGSSEAFGYVSAAAVAVAVGLPVAAHIESAAETISAACRFSGVLTPVLSALFSAGGYTATAVSYGAFARVAGGVLTIIASSVVVPLLRALLALALCSSVSPVVELGGLVKSVEKCSKWLIGFLAALFSGALGVSSVAAAAADGAGGRAMKFVISGAVPVVGGALADAAATVKNCVGIIRSSVGAYGIIAGMFIFVPTIIESVVWIAALELTGAAAEMLGAKKPASLMKSLSSVMKITLSATVLAAVLLCCSAAIVIMVRGG